MDGEHAARVPSPRTDPVAVQVPLWDWNEVAPAPSKAPLGVPASSSTLPASPLLAAERVTEETQPVVADAVAVITRSLSEMAQVETRPLLDPPSRAYRLRRLGEAPIHIFPVVLGGGAFGWTASAEAATATLDAYREAGGNAIATAADASAGRSEILIGSWLRQRGGRDGMVLSSMIGGEESAPLTALNVVSSVDASLERLGTDHLDVLVLGSDSGDTPIEETLTAASSLISKGKVRYLAAAGYSPEKLIEARVTAGQLGLPRFVAASIDYSVLDRLGFEEGLSPVARAQELAVLPTSSLGGGFLSGRYRGKRGDHSSVAQSRAARIMPHLGKRGFRILAALDQIAERHEATPAAISLAWLLTKPLITAPVVTASKPEQIADLVQATKVHLTRAEVASLDRASAA